MKKNILAIIILAATLVNLTLCAVMLFVYMPNAQKMNTLISKICQQIDIELESPLPVQKEDPVLATDLEAIIVGENMTIKLSKGTDGKDHYMQVTASVVLNTKAEDYKTIQPLMTSQVERIKEIIQNPLGDLTYDNYEESKELVKQEILETLQAEFTTKCIYRIDFGTYFVP
ncbi:MAG: flagellar basal body-associated FliL family protein [Lachnospiraceae bacterium]|nr:flagellar basal body-associated FliL family protein [Lachnospiraceae bacterium]